METHTPLISIITVVYNSEKHIERTIKSVINQNYKNIEYIIIDGASTDNTLNIINQYKNNINKIISEKDKGLYDAMNKGLNMATGDYVWFLNSGDQIANENILTKIVQLPVSDIYYGETIMVDDANQEIGMRRLATPDKLTWKSFKKGMVVSHQSIIIKKTLTEKFDLKYRFSADFDWVLKSLKKTKKITNTYLILTRYLDGGLTKKNIKKGLKERFKIMIKNYGLIPTLWSHFLLGIRFFLFVSKHKRF